MRVRYQRQPSTHTCGQTVMAMLLGVPVAQVIAELGEKRTRVHHFVEYLQPRGLRIADRLLRLAAGDLLPSTAVLRVLWRNAGSVGHWTLWHDGRVFDPLLPETTPYRGIPGIIVRGGRVTSFLRVQGRHA